MGKFRDWINQQLLESDKEDYDFLQNKYERLLKKRKNLKDDGSWLDNLRNRRNHRLLTKYSNRLQKAGDRLQKTKDIWLADKLLPVEMSYDEDLYNAPTNAPDLDIPVETSAMDDIVELEMSPREEVLSEQRTVYSRPQNTNFSDAFRSATKVNRALGADNTFLVGNKNYSTRTWDSFLKKNLTLDLLKKLYNKEDEKAWQDLQNSTETLNHIVDANQTYHGIVTKNADGTYNVFDFSGAKKLRGSGFDYNDFWRKAETMNDILNTKNLQRKARTGMKILLRFLRGGQVNYYQQGGQANAQQKALQMFISDLAAVTGAKSEQDLKAVVSKLGEEGISQVFQIWALAMLKNGQNDPDAGKKAIAQAFSGGKSSQGQTSGPEQIAYNAPPSAQLGRMGLRFHELQGTCPEGYEIDKFLAGGCVKCRKKKALELKCQGKKRFTKH